MKTLVEQINEISYKGNTDNYFKSLEKALYDYHAMIIAGELIPRGNKIETLQNNIINYSIKKTNLR